eukprot:COSAG05_NODE_1862_length_3942_cov_5.107468_3_plen_459_part_00
MRWQLLNGSDLACADVRGENQKYPKGTSDAAGIALCESYCANRTECGGFVYVTGSPASPTPGGPRCAIKGTSCCPGQQRGGVTAALKPGTCMHPHPHPHPHPPSPSPSPSPAPTGPPTHVHEAANSYTLVHHTPGSAKDEAGTISPVENGGATVVSAAALGFKRACDHGQYGFPKTFVDPVKGRRLQYGWVRGPGLAGEADAMLGELTLKNNHQSLLREVTYDPRLGILCFSPIQETALLRQAVLASIPGVGGGSGGAGVHIAAGGVLPIGDAATHGGAANQSEIRLSFAVPKGTITLGARVMCSGHPSGACFEIGLAFTPPPLSNIGQGQQQQRAWLVEVTGRAANNGDPEEGGGIFVPMLKSDQTIELVIYVDHTVVETYVQGGRLALTQHLPVNLLQPGPAGNITAQQSVEVFARSSGGGGGGGAEGVTMLNATMWRMDDIWSDPVTHGRPRHKP